MLRRQSIAVFVLILGLHAAGAAVSADDEPELILDELGMLPRPTMECGGKDAIQHWERERRIRRNHRARERIWGALYPIAGRLQDAFDKTASAMHLSRVQAFESCTGGERLLDLRCIAAARRRPELCDAKDDPEFLSACRALTVALIAALEGDHLRCAELAEPQLRRVCERAVLGRPERSVNCPKDDGHCHVLALLNIDVCRRFWSLIQLAPPAQAICRWVVLTELLREDPARSCETVPAPVREQCHAVLSGDPASCVLDDEKLGTAVLGRRCRNAQVLAPEVPLDQVAYGKGVVVSVPMMNPFDTVAACRVTVRLSEGEHVRFEATSDPFTIPGSFQDEARDMLVLKRFRMAPVDAGLELSVTADCAWAPGDRFTTRSDGTPVVD